MVSAFIANLIRYRQEGYRPNRDIILVLETDEEIGDAKNLGITWFLENHRSLIDAEFALNEGAGVGLKNGQPIWNGVQTSEKVGQTFRLEVRNPGGHSSQPRSDNVISQLTAALVRLQNYQFPVQLNETTRGYFKVLAHTRITTIKTPSCCLKNKCLPTASKSTLPS